MVHHSPTVRQQKGRPGTRPGQFKRSPNKNGVVCRLREVGSTLTTAGALICLKPGKKRAAPAEWPCPVGIVRHTESDREGCATFPSRLECPAGPLPRGRREPYAPLARVLALIQIRPWSGKKSREAVTSASRPL